MKKNKINIENMQMSNIDLNLIKDFIDLYDDIKEKIEEYNKLCDDLRTNIHIRKELNENPGEDIIVSFNRTRNKLIKKISLSKSESELLELNEQIRELQKTTKQLNQYDSILKIYNNTIYGKSFPSEYFTNNTCNNKYQYLKQQESTITQVYRYVKYLYEICEKIYDYKPEKKSKSILSIIKTKIHKLKLKKTINKVKQEFIKDNEMNIARIDESLFIDMDSLEQNFEYYKMFEEPIYKFILDNNQRIKQAVEEAEQPLENEIIISNNNYPEPEIIELDKQQQIQRLKEVKQQLTQQEIEKEIIIPTKTA